MRSQAVSGAESRRRPSRGAALLLAGSLLGICAGCSSPHQPCTVGGEVYFNGKPVEKGAIRFVTDEQTPGSGGVGSITDGVYEVQTKGMLSGKYVVMISGFHDTGKTLVIDGNEIQDLKQYIPRKYNAEATLTVELEPGANTQDFSLTP